jgi:predicted DNA-binding transcriptional regulator AlpA
MLHRYQYSTAIPVEASDPEARIPANEVRHLCGGVSDMTLHRWLNSETLAFPRPIYIGRRRYWRRSEIVTWMNTRAAEVA